MCQVSCPEPLKYRVKAAKRMRIEERPGDRRRRGSPVPVSRLHVHGRFLSASTSTSNHLGRIIEAIPVSSKIVLLKNGTRIRYLDRFCAWGRLG